MQHNDYLTRKQGVRRAIAVKPGKLKVNSRFSLNSHKENSDGKQMENTELSMICRFVKLLVNEVKFFAVKTGWLVKCAKSNSNIRRLICKCKHVCNINIFHASCWCQFQRNSHFKRLYVSPKSNFSQFWRHLLTEPLPDILTDFLILFLKSRVDNLEEGYTIYAGVLYLYNGFLQWN